MKYPQVFIFEGGDGTGKTTQSLLLCKFLNNHLWVKVTYFSFPVYEFPFGRVIGNSILGRWGKKSGSELLPDEAAWLYALNRLEVLPFLKKTLSQQEIVICNRGPYANAYSIAKELINENISWNQLSSTEKGERFNKILSDDQQFLEVVSAAGLENVFFTLDPQESMILARNRDAQFLGQKPDSYASDFELQKLVATIFSDLGLNRVEGHQGILIEATRTLPSMSSVNRLNISQNILEKFGGILETSSRLFSQIKPFINLKDKSEERYVELISQYLSPVVEKGEGAAQEFEFRTKNPSPPPDLWKTNPQLMESMIKNHPQVIKAIQSSQELDQKRGLA